MVLATRRRKWWATALAVPLVMAVLGAPVVHGATAQEAGPLVADPALAVRTAVSGLDQPTSMAFLDSRTLLVTEKRSGAVRVVTLPATPSATPTANATATVAVDLPVNSFSERGLLGIATHPGFPRAPYVYLYWTRSATGQDTVDPAAVELLGNRVDRFRWDPATRSLRYDRPVVALRARQHDPTNYAVTPATATATSTAATIAPLERGNHNGGKILFGRDGKLYVQIGDEGRRGQLQNLPDGPGCFAPRATPTVATVVGRGLCPGDPQGNLPDDQYGGPEPDDAHLTGVVLRLNPDGTTPRDNPFVRAGRERGGEVGRNYAKIWAYGVRNGFGLAVDPHTGALWDAQNGDDSFSEINRVPAGANLGWIQVMGSSSRAGQYRTIETTQQPIPPDPRAPAGYYGLQQARFDPALLAGERETARARMFHVRVGARQFVARLSGRQEVPANDSGATGRAIFTLRSDGSMDYVLDVALISNVFAAHVHLGGPGQNGPVAVPLFSRPATRTVSTYDRRRIAAGRITAEQIAQTLPRFGGTPQALLERLRQGRAYVNVHTTGRPAGEVRGQVVPLDGEQLSRYVGPQLSWAYEVAPVGIGFHRGTALGAQYRGDLFVGQAIPVSEGGRLFRLELSPDRQRIVSPDDRLADRVADNRSKYDTQESESLLFGTRFGSAVDIRTGPNGNLFVLSLSNGSLYEVHRR